MAKEATGQEGSGGELGMSLDAGADRILGFLDQDGPDDGEPEGDGADEGDDGEDSVEGEEELEDDGGDDEDDEDSDDADAGEDDEDEDDDVEDDEDAVEDDDSTEPTFKVKVNGEEQEVSEAEVIAGYQRQKDYTQKTQALAKDREDLSSERQTLQSTLSDYGARLQAVHKILAVEEPDWDAVKKDNPGKYLELRDAYQTRKEELSAVEAELTETRNAALKELQTQRTQQAKATVEKLQSLVPEWVDQDTMKADLDELSKVAIEEFGYTPEEVGSVVDHRTILILRAAAQQVKQEQSGEDTEQKVKDTKRRTRKKGKTLKPGTRTPVKGADSRKNRRLQSNSQRLQQSGKIKDATAVLSDLLDE